MKKNQISEYSDFSDFIFQKSSKWSRIETLESKGVDYSQSWNQIFYVTKSLFSLAPAKVSSLKIQCLVATKKWSPDHGNCYCKKKNRKSFGTVLNPLQKTTVLSMIVLLAPKSTMFYGQDWTVRQLCEKTHENIYKKKQYLKIIHYSKFVKILTDSLLTASL